MRATRVHELVGWCALLAVAGCAGTTVYGRRPEAPSVAPGRATFIYRHLVVGENITIRAAGGLGGGGARAFDIGGVRATALDGSLERGLADAVTTSSEERALSRSRDTALLLRFELRSWTETVDRADEDLALCTVFGSLTLMLGYLPCASTRHDTEHVVDVALTIFDVRDAPIARVEDRGELRRVLDTSAVPHVERRYQVRFRSGIGVTVAEASQLEAHARAEGERAAQLVLAAAAADLTAAARIVSAARPRTEPAVSAVPQAGGELGMSEVEVAAPPQDEVGSTPAPSFPQRVRAQIESRAALVVACTGTPTLAIRATWGAQGLVLFEPVGVSSPDVVECVQAAIGELPVGGPPGSLLHAVGR